NELPQTFESVEPLEAHVAWNAMRPRLAQRQPLFLAKETLMLADPVGGPARVCPSLWLAGTASGLAAGDLLVVRIAGQAIPLVVTGVVVDDEGRRTRVDVQQPGAQDPPPFGFPDLEDGTVSSEPVQLTAKTVRQLVL